MYKYTSYIVLTILIFLMNGCSSITVQEKMEDQLCEAFEDDSIPLLNRFFEEWHQLKKPITDFEFENTNDTVRILYNVFNDFSNTEIRKYPKLFNSPYCIIQSTLKFRISSRKHLDYPLPALTIIVVDTLKDFRPAPNLLSSKIIYKNDFYDKILDDFIKSDCGEDNEKKYNDLTWRGWPRANFLEQVVHIHAALLGFSYHTLPYVSLDFNKDLSEVIIHSSLASSWTSELFALREGKWKFIKYFYTAVN